jgi:hypothetical protein
MKSFDIKKTWRPFHPSTLRRYLPHITLQMEPNLYELVNQTDLIVFVHCERRVYCKQL